jgi:shikimate kinase
MNIVLIGYRGTGKTTISKLLAEEMDFKLVSTDELVIEKAGMQISEIVEKHGWSKFREYEKKAVDDISELDDCVIDCGGGVVEDNDNVKVLRENGKIVLLEADVKTIIARIQGTDRPALLGKSSVEEIGKVLEKRKDLYHKAADFNLDTCKLSVHEAVHKILEKVR